MCNNMRGLGKSLPLITPREGRIQSFVWQLGWVDCPIIQSNNITLRRSMCGSPSKKKARFGPLYTEKYWNKSLAKSSDSSSNDEKKEEVFIEYE